MCTGKHVLDVTSGFRAVNQRFIAIYAEDYPSDYPEPEAIITAVMHKGRVAEVPVVMKERAVSYTHLDVYKRQLEIFRIRRRCFQNLSVSGKKVISV